MGWSNLLTNILDIIDIFKLHCTENLIKNIIINKKDINIMKNNIEEKINYCLNCKAKPCS